MTLLHPVPGYKLSAGCQATSDRPCSSVMLRHTEYGMEYIVVIMLQSVVSFSHLLIITAVSGTMDQ